MEFTLSRVISRKYSHTHTHRQTTHHSTLRSLIRASDLLKPSAWCYYAGLNSLHVGECQSMYCKGTLCQIKYPLNTKLKRVLQCQISCGINSMWKVVVNGATLAKEGID